MPNLPDLMVIADAMIRRYGDRALAVLQHRAEENLQADEPEAAELWSKVAAIVRVTQRPATPSLDQRSLDQQRPQ